ncbi:MFS transporter [Corynebacterium vitaeruminis]|uniref:MFS transporter n=1 Tax=Corynebacterium vitaeruminis TaxID=38305 RepID=UPI0028AD5649|nr:MFS transporter [Corynebacterium vitaeruminis]
MTSTRTPGVFPLLVAVAAGFAAFSLMLPVAPLAVLDAGGGASLAGATTAAFMGVTVLTQLATSRAIDAVGYRVVMMVSAAFLGLPALAQLLSENPWVILGISAVRGVGFGTLVVTQYALAARLVPASALGRVSGAVGVAGGAAQMVGLPLGLAIASSWAGFAGVYVLTAAVGLAGAALCLIIPNPASGGPPLGEKEPPLGEKEPPLADKESPLADKESPLAENKPPLGEKEPPLAGEDSAPKASTSNAKWGRLLVPALALSSVSMGYGAVSSFLPAAARDLDPAAGAAIAGVLLSLVGGAQMVSRYGAGVSADRTQRAGFLLLPGLVVAGVGIAGTWWVLVGHEPVWWLVPLMLAFGAGFGVVQNEALLVLFSRVPRAGITRASTAWNVAFDAGTGVGSLLLGAVAGAIGFGGAFLVGAGLVAAGFALVSAEHAAFRRQGGQPRRQPRG